jgi:hypothetical protein
MFVIKNGMHVYTQDPRGRTFEMVFRDFDVKPGKACYDVRLLQRDPEAPDGDPETAWSSPIFVRHWWVGLKRARNGAVPGRCLAHISVARRCILNSVRRNRATPSLFSVLLTCC